MYYEFVALIRARFVSSVTHQKSWRTSENEKSNAKQIGARRESTYDDERYTSKMASIGMNKHAARQSGATSVARVSTCGVRGQESLSSRTSSRHQLVARRRTVNSLLTEVSYVENDSLFVVDEKQMIEGSSFPIKQEELIQKTRDFLAANNGCEKPELLSEDFTFAGPVVGPISKDEFIKAFSSFSITEAFPDMKPNFYNFHVDPFEQDRVWFCSRATGTHTGVFAGSMQPTGKKFISPPQMSSCKFNKEGQVTHLTAGYILDRAEGNTGGLGGVFGILYAIGKPLPFPEAQPWKKSWQYKFFGWFGAFMQKVSGFFKKKE